MSLIKVNKNFEIYLSKRKVNDKAITISNKTYYRFMDKLYIPRPVYKLSSSYVKELNNIREKYITTIIDKNYNKNIIYNIIKYLEINNITDVRILDFGCGNGYPGYLIKKEISKSKLFGFDIRKPLRRKYLNYYDNIEIKDINASLPYPNNFFDVITSFFVFHFFIPDTQLNELKRVIKQDGILYFNLINSSDFNIINKIEKLGFKLLEKKEIKTASNIGQSYTYKLAISKDDNKTLDDE